MSNMVKRCEARGAARMIGVAGGAGSAAVRGALGKLPVKANRAGKLQPYDPTTGRFLSYGANSAKEAFPRSPVGRFLGYIGYGAADARGLGPVPDPVGPIERAAYWIGYIGGQIF